MAASLAPKSWDPEIDYDIYKLIAHLTVVSCVRTRMAAI